RRSCGACEVCGSTPDWVLAGNAEYPHKDRKTKSPATARRRASRPSSGARIYALPVEHRGLREHFGIRRQYSAKRQGIPAFTVMHDTSRDDLCRVMTESLAALRQVYGFGERKTERYGREILAAIKQFQQRTHVSKGTGHKAPAREETIQLEDN